MPDVIIRGSTYSGCSELDIPIEGGGIAKFMDTSDADATASDILEGKTAYVNGKKVAGALTIDDELSETSTNPVQNNVVTTAINNIKESKADIIITSASGSIAQIEDAGEYLAEDLTIGIEPVQDLHGYDNPWPAGGGKNLLDKSQIADVYPTMKTINLALKPNTQYTASSSLPLANGASNFFFHLPGESEETSTNGVYNGVSRTITTGADGIAVVAYRLGAYTAQEWLSYNYQVEEGSTATSYAPYSNICPISGWTEANVVRTGKNLFDKNHANFVNGYIDVSVFKTTNLNAKTIYIPIKPNTTYTVSKIVTARFSVTTSDVIPSNNAAHFERAANNSASSLTITSPSNAKYLWAWIYLDGTDTVSYNDVIDSLQVELGSTASEYKIYQSNIYPISWQSEAGTVYGGGLDVTTGVLTVDKALVTFNGSDDEDWTYYSVAQGNLFRVQSYGSMKTTVSVIPAISNSFKTVPQGNRANGTISSGVNSKNIDFIYDEVNSLAAWKTWLSSNNVQLCYELAAPITYQLTPYELELFFGNNNIWSDTGDAIVQYKADTKLYIDHKISPTPADIGAIAAPSSPSSGAFLVWDGSAWTAQTLSTWSGGSY